MGLSDGVAKAPCRTRRRDPRGTARHKATRPASARVAERSGPAGARSEALGANASLAAVGAAGLTLGMGALFLPLGGLGIVLCTTGWLVGLGCAVIVALRVRALARSKAEPVPRAVGWKG